VALVSLHFRVPHEAACYSYLNEEHIMPRLKRLKTNFPKSCSSNKKNLLYPSYPYSSTCVTLAVTMNIEHSCTASGGRGGASSAASCAGGGGAVAVRRKGSRARRRRRGEPAASRRVARSIVSCVRVSMTNRGYP
jgi:hypothetical protein